MHSFNKNIFKGREDAKTVFNEILQSENQWILVYSGMAGLGKTALLNWLRDYRCKAENIDYIEFKRISLIESDIYSIESLVDNIFDQTRDDCPEDVVEKFKIRIREAESDLEADLKNYYNKASADSQGSDTDGSDAHRVRRSQQKAKDRHIKALTRYAKSLSDRQIVFFCDDLNRASEEDQQWFWELMYQLHGIMPGLVLVIATRRLSGFEPGSSYEYTLSELSPDESEELLIELEVTDADFRRATYDHLTFGNPFLIYAIAEQWSDANISGKPMIVEDIPAFHQTEQAAEWLNILEINKLKQPFRTLAMFSVIFRRFNREILNQVIMPVFKRPSGKVPQLSEEDFNDFHKFSFIVPVEEGQYWKIHDMYADGLMRKIRQNKSKGFNKINKLAIDYFEQSKNELEAFHHRLLFELPELQHIREKEGVLVKWGDAIQDARKSYNLERAKSLLALSENLALEVTDIQRAVMDIEHAHYYRQIGESKQSEEKYDAAKAFYEQNPTHDSSDYFYHMWHGYAMLLSQRGRTDEAREIFQRLLRDFNPDDPYVLNAWARMEAKADNVDEARKLFRTNAGNNGRDIPSLNAWAIFEFDQQNYNTSRKLLDRVLMLAETDPEHSGAVAHIGLARIARANEDYDAARKHYAEALELGASPTNLYFQANMEKELGEYSKARTLFTELNERVPDHRMGLIDWALMEFSHGDSQRATSLYEKAMELPMPLSNQIKTLETWGQLEWRNQNYRIAANIFERKFEVLQNTDDVENQLNTLRNWARLEIKQNNFDKAADIYENLALTIDMDNVKVLNDWAKMENSRDKTDKYNELMDLIDTIKGSGKNPSRPYEEARRLIKERKDDEARPLLLEVIELNQGHNKALYAMGELEARARDFEACDFYFERLISIAPNNYDAMNTWAITAMKAANDDVAIERFERLLAMHGIEDKNERAAKRKMATIEAGRGNILGARKHFEDILRKFPNNMKTYWDWAQTEHQNDKLDYVQSLIERAIKVEPDSLKPLGEWANDEEKRGNLSGAIKLLQHEINSKPENDYSRATLARIYKELEEYDLAREQYQIVLNEINPESDYCASQWAIMEFQLEDFDYGNELFDLAISINPHNVTTLETAGRMNWGVNRYKDAAKYFQQIIDFQPKNVSALFNLAKVYDKVDHSDDAIDLCERILAIRSKHDGARNMLNRLMPPERFEGRIKFFKQDKGFGFIARDGDDDLFVHKTEIQNYNTMEIKQSEAVEFSVGPGKKGVQATYVVRLDLNSD